MGRLNVNKGLLTSGSPFPCGKAVYSWFDALDLSFFKFSIAVSRPQDTCKASLTYTLCPVPVRVASGAGQAWAGRVCHTSTHSLSIVATGTKYKATPLILLPQGIGGSTFTLEVIYNEQSYKASLAIPAEGWLAGYSYTYNVTIKNTGLEVTKAEISGWKTPTIGGTTDGDATLQ